MSAFTDIFKAKLLETLCFTISFLESNKLKWFAAYGTAIGAVRHKGIIPWDDDIDICMPRDDYNKLLALSVELKDTKYRIIKLGDNNYWLPFAKIYDASTTILERKEYPCVFGVYIDIFPYDSINEETAKNFNAAYNDIALSYRRYSSCQKKINFKKYLSLLRTGHWGTLKSLISFDMMGFSSEEKILNEIRKKEQFYSDDNGSYYGSFTEPYRKYFKKEWFSSSIWVPFDGHKVRIPMGYDKYLTSIYGDYMSLPPVEKRVLKHGVQRCYCNLKEGLTILEVMERIKKGEKLVF